MEDYWGCVDEKGCVLMEKGLCSIIMPAYNAGMYIGEAIDSVLAQTYANFELIIIDDCSKDNTREIIQQYMVRDNRIVPYFNNDNVGCAESRNKGLSLCQGEYVAFVDSDDIWFPNKLSTQISFLEQSRESMSFTAYEIIDSCGKPVKPRKVKSKLVLQDLLKENSVIFSTTVFRAEVIKNLSFKSEWYHEDYVFLLDCLTKGQFCLCGIDEDLVKYRVHEAGRSFNKVNAAKFRWKIYREYLKLNIFECLFYFLEYAFKGIVKYC